MKFRIFFVLTAAVLLFSCGAATEPETAPETAAAPLAPSGWASNFVEANGLRLHYWRTGGEGKPVMILAHGSTDYGLNMATLAQEFTDDYDIIMYDARGHGHSDKPEGPYGADANAADLVGLVEALGIEKPILMGHSMGATTVAAVGARHPDLPRAVIMEDPGLLRAPSSIAITPEEAAERAEARAAGIRESKQASKEEFAERSRVERHPDWQHDIDHVRMAEAMSLVSPNIAFSTGTTSAQLSSKLVNITAPTLILKADADEEQRKLHIETVAKMPNAKIVHMDGAGHMIRFERPAETVREIRAFLATLP